MADRFAVWFWPLLLVTLALFFWPFGLPRWVAWIWSLAVSPLLVLTGSRVQLAAAPRRVALTLGALSYPVYALHYPIFVWVNGAYQFAFHGKNYVIGSAFVFPSVLLGGWIILRSFDEPARERLTSWTRRKSAGVSTA